MPSSAEHPNSIQRVGRWLASQRWLHYLLLAGAMTLLAAGMHRQHWRWSDALDNLLLDTSFRLRTPHTPEEVAEKLPATRDIVMIELPSPVTRIKLAEVVTLLSKAKGVALDLMLVNQKNEYNKEEQKWYARDLREQQVETTALASAISLAHNVVIGTWGDERWDPVPGRYGKFTRNVVWERPEDTLWNAARYHCHLSGSADEMDQLVRHAPLFLDIPVQITDKNKATRIERLPCLALALAAAGDGVYPAQLHKLLAAAPRPDGMLMLGGRRIPYTDTQLTIDFVGDRQCFEYGTNCVEYDRALRLDEQDDFAGKLVIVGGSDLKAHDTFQTPYGIMLGMQVHANILATLRSVNGAPLTLSARLLFLLGFACSLLVIIPLFRWPIWSSLVMALAEIALVFALAVFLWLRRHTIVPISVPTISVALTYNAVIIYEYNRVRMALGKFIGPDMVKRALYMFSHLRLGEGSVEHASAMFCDLRSFTNVAESFPPETISTLLNEYTNAVVKVARSFKGRPIDFYGDGVFLLFEEALAGRDYPLRAVNAALAVLPEFARCRERWVNRGLPPLDIGIAVHTGRVMIGLIGSEHLLHMGAIGDVINVTARVQGLSADCGFNVLITEETYEATGRQVAAERCGTYPVRGREQPVVIYGLTAARQVAEVSGDQ